MGHDLLTYRRRSGLTEKPVKKIIPYLKQIGMYKIVQMAVRAAEKLGITGAIQKADKKKYVIAALEKMNIKVTPTIEMMIEAAVKEMDIQNNKINAEFKKD